MHSQNKLSLTIRSAQLDEASEISKMIIKNVNYFHVNSYTKEEIKIWERGYSISEMRKQILNKEVYVMRNDDMIYDTIQFDCPEIKGFYVNPEFKSMGFGSILLQFMLSNLRIRGHKQVELTSNSNTVGFYRKFGFKQIKEEIVYWEKHPFIEYRMIKSLNKI